ncbi:MAG: hypothetical protein GF332_01640 [Candidatus Moranbacteria bacterium]|nr:hypothetical protein [Candidatus Moranbacteria bacterium]
MKKIKILFLTLFLIFTIFMAFFVYNQTKANPLDETVTITAEVLANVTINFTAIPEKRVPLTGNNSTQAYIEVRNVGSTTPIDTFGPIDTDNNGIYSSALPLTGITPGTYDVAVNGYSHLKLKKTVTLVSGLNNIDFTDAGTNPLLVGDAYGTGDNMVNSLDISYIQSQWGVIDSGVSDNRADVDENHQVNSMDVTKANANYGKVGD